MFCDRRQNCAQIECRIEPIESRGRSRQARVVLRSRIVLLAAEGMQNKQIAAALKVAPRMAALWRSRFIELGIEGLLQDAPRPGRTPKISRR